MGNRQRQPEVAGVFYPADPKALKQQLEGFLSGLQPTLRQPPKALIAPHAGYAYSGAVAAHAYIELLPLRHQVERVVLLAPAHRLAFSGIAYSQADSFLTPLGAIPIAKTSLESLDDLPQVQALEQAFNDEHSVEVQLPFLQLLLEHFQLLPLLVGQSTPEAVSAVLERLWGGDETRIVISSDLSHFLDYSSAQAFDLRTAAAIEALDYERLDYHSACGRTAISGLLHSARQRDGIQVTRLDLRNSGDSAIGNRDQVVGYGAFALG